MIHKEYRFPSARVIQVIETDLREMGEGTPGDPHRRIIQYYSLDGELLAEHDTWADEKESTE